MGWLRAMLEFGRQSSKSKVVLPMSPSPSQRAQEVYEFGPFRVDPGKETLRRDGEPVSLTPKTFQILLVLIRNNKEVVTKDDLMKMVWPDTFVEEANLSRNIFMLRRALGETAQDHRYIVTVPGRGYRLAENVRLVPEQEVTIVAASHSSVQINVQETDPWRWALVVVVILIAAVAGAFWFASHRGTVLSAKDTVVLADFSNSTGDSVFDEALRQGMAVQLEQSPFLKIVSDARIQRTLGLMGRPPDTRLTPELTREICERTGSAAVLEGSISRLENQYVLALGGVGRLRLARVCRCAARGAGSLWMDVSSLPVWFVCHSTRTGVLKEPLS